MSSCDSDSDSDDTLQGVDVPSELTGNWQYILKNDDVYVCHMLGINNETGTHQLRTQIDDETSSTVGYFTLSANEYTFNPTFGDSSAKFAIRTYGPKSLTLSLHGEELLFNKVDTGTMPYYKSNKGKPWIGTWMYVNEATGHAESYKFNIHGEYVYKNKIHALDNEGRYSFSDDGKHLTIISNTGGTQYLDVRSITSDCMVIDGNRYDKL